MPIDLLVTAFDLPGKMIESTTVQAGYINHTYRYVTTQGDFILQRLNDKVFAKLNDVMDNVANVCKHLQLHAPPPHLLLKYTICGAHSAVIDGRRWRCYHTVANAECIEQLENPEQAYQVAHAFGQFQQVMSSYKNDLHNTLPCFHDTSWRYAQLQQAAAKATPQRIDHARAMLLELEGCAHLATQLEALHAQGAPVRVCHQDAKINNILFCKHTKKTLCVIDLDTVMYGNALVDFGDMVRSMSAGDIENTIDISAIELDKQVYNALSEGYLDAVGHMLQPCERQALPVAARVIAFEQAVRFLADYLLGDVYYPIDYSEHNLMRSQTQIALLKQLFTL